MNKHTPETCQRTLLSVKDTLYVLNGKWKLPIIIALSEGPLRFKELQRTLENITPKVLSKELKELEMHEFLQRTVHATTPVTVEYSLLPYSDSLQPAIDELSKWGMAHKQRVIARMKDKTV